MNGVRRWAGRSGLAVVATLVLTLAACGAETTTSGLRGAGTPNADVVVGTTVPNGSPEPYPTPIPPPYAFPKTWQTATGAPTQVSMLDGMTFAPSAPMTGYACDDTSPPATTNSTQAAVLYVTHDGGQSWSSLPNSPLTQLAGICSVFLDSADANDVFLQSGMALSGQPAPSIWRSRDGGMTWHQLTFPAVPGWSITLQKLTVLGTRLIVSVSINQEGQLPNDLYASDDGGASWHQFAASLPPNVGDFVTLGGAIVVEVDQTVGVDGPATTARPAGDRTLTALLPRSSGGPAPVFYRSNDGGNSWVKVTFPGGLPVFTQAASGSAYYGVSIAAPTSQGAPATAYWTQDSGATWTALPTLQGVEGGWIESTSLGIGLVVGPDGSVYTDTLHTIYQGESDAGIFMVRPTDGTPAWQPLALGAPYSLAVLPETGGGLRLVNLRMTNQADYTATPAYLDLP